MSYEVEVSSRSNRSRVGKSRSVLGAEILRWIIIRPQERWNMRSEKLPCSRVTWLWYSSMGLMERLPNSSSRAYGPNTELNSTRA